MRFDNIIESKIILILQSIVYPFFPLLLFAFEKQEGVSTSSVFSFVKSHSALLNVLTVTNAGVSNYDPYRYKASSSRF